MNPLPEIKQYETLMTLGRLVPEISWFILPFLIWIEIYWLLGQSFFILLSFWPLIIFISIGILVVIASMISFWWITIRLWGLEFRLMKQVESVKDVFNKPADPDLEKKLWIDCEKFLLPYIYYPGFFLSGYPRLFYGHKKARIFSYLFSTTLFLLASYWIVTFLINNQNYLSDVYSQISHYIPIEISQIGGFLVHNPPFLILSLIILSFWHDRIIKDTVKGRIKFSRLPFTSHGFDILFSVSHRVIKFFNLVTTLFWRIKREEKSLKYEPFIFYTDIPSIIKKSFYAVEREECKVSVLKYPVVDEKSINKLRQMILESRDLSFFIKFPTPWARPDEILNKVKDMEPTIFLGTVKDRCVVFGKLEHDSIEHIWVLNLFFANKHVRKVFKSTANSLISDGRKSIKASGDVLKNISESHS